MFLTTHHTLFPTSLHFTKGNNSVRFRFFTTRYNHWGAWGLMHSKEPSNRILYKDIFRVLKSWMLLLIFSGAFYNNGWIFCKIFIGWRMLISYREQYSDHWTCNHFPSLNEKILWLCHWSCHIGYVQAQLSGKGLFVQMMEKELLI